MSTSNRSIPTCTRTSILVTPPNSTCQAAHNSSVQPSKSPLIYTWELGCRPSHEIEKKSTRCIAHCPIAAQLKRLLEQCSIAFPKAKNRNTKAAQAGREPSCSVLERNTHAVPPQLYDQHGSSHACCASLELRMERNREPNIIFDFCCTLQFEIFRLIKGVNVRTIAWIVMLHVRRFRVRTPLQKN